MSYNSYGLTNVIDQVRRRRQLLLALRGLAISMGLGAMLLVIVGLIANRYRHSNNALISLRILIVLGIVAAIYFFLMRPLFKRISDHQLARLIEERQRDLGDSFVTAIEFTAEDAPGTSSKHPRFASGAIVNRLVERTNQQAVDVDLNKVIHQREVWAYGSAAVSCMLLLGAVMVWGPQTIFSGVTQLVTPTTAAAAPNPNSLYIVVKPGTARVPKGSDQQISATLVNFNTEAVTFYQRTVAEKPAAEEGSENSNSNGANSNSSSNSTTDQWTSQVMEPAKNKNDFQLVVFNVQDSSEYFVESNGIKSEVFKFDVVDLPYVKRLDLLLNFPTYTRIAAKAMEDTGDIAALKGTVVRVTAKLTGKAKSARIVLSDNRKIEMKTEGENDFAGSLTVAGNTSYHIELVSVDNETYNGSNEYDITTLEDQPPVVSFEKPGRDARASNLEEVFTQAKAEDDYGIASLEMFFSVNGGPEQKVALQNLKSDAARTRSGVHTFFLEEHNLKPGDFVSYYAKARDAASEATSDIYFIEIRPFELQFRQAQQQGGGGGGGGGEDQNALTRRQKDLIAATFRLLREGGGRTAQERADNYSTVMLGQERLRNDAGALVDRIKRRLGSQLGQEQDFVKMVEHLTQAAQEMNDALTRLKGQAAADALPAEQRALQQLLRADAIFREKQVASGSEGGGGGGSAAQAEELADLFELELDKMKNQYETLRREQQQQGQQSAGQGKDEAQRKLEELARRQQQALEQQQRRQQSGPRNASNSGGGGGGGGGSQRQQQELIDETRQTARELERLSRERRDPQMQQLSQQLKQAADEMQRAQAASQGNNQNEAVAQNSRALERLEEARRRMDGAQQTSRGQSIQNLRQRAANAAARQREITKDVDELAKRRGGQQGDDAAITKGDKQQLAERKESLAESLDNLEKDVEQAARANGSGAGNSDKQGQQKAGEGLRAAASSLQRDRVAERVRRNNQNIENNQLEAARAGERAIQESLNKLNEQLQAAEQSANNRRGGAASTDEALDRTRQLADNLESLRRRMSENQGQRDQQQQQRGQQQVAQGNRAGQSQQGNNSGQQQSDGQQQQGKEQQQEGQQQARGQSNGEQQGGQSGEQKGKGQQGGGEGQQQQQGQSAGRGGGQSSPRGGQYNGGPLVGGGRTMGGAAAGDDRQLGAELRERLREAEDLRRQLGRGAGDLSKQLDQAIEQLRGLSPSKLGSDNETGRMLKSQVIDPLRQVELELSRRLQAKLGRSNLRLSDEGAAPERYRKLVDEYYKRLSSRPVRP